MQIILALRPPAMVEHWATLPMNVTGTYTTVHPLDPSTAGELAEMALPRILQHLQVRRHGPCIHHANHETLKQHHLFPPYFNYECSHSEILTVAVS